MGQISQEQINVDLFDEVKRLKNELQFQENLKVLLRQKVERYEKALGDINEYIPTKEYRKDVHNLKTIADEALK